MDLYILSTIVKLIFISPRVMADAVSMVIRKQTLTTFVVLFMDRVIRQQGIQEEPINRVAEWVSNCTRGRIACRMEKTFTELLALDINVRC